MRSDIIKLLEENIGTTLSDINCRNTFFDLSPRITEIKTKLNKCSLLNLKIFGMAKKTIYKMKRQPTDWKKIFANDVTDKGLVSKIYKQLMILNSIKKKPPNQQIGRRPKQTFFQRRHTDGQEAHEKMFNITIREMQIKTTMRDIT